MTTVSLVPKAHYLKDNISACLPGTEQLFVAMQNTRCTDHQGASLFLYTPVIISSYTVSHSNHYVCWRHGFFSCFSYCT